jgi:hypothetical protein
MEDVRFRSLIDMVHRSWLADMLGMDVNDEEGNWAGIDVVDEDKGVEIKARMTGVHSRNHHHFTIHDRQYAEFPKEYEDRTLFFALMKYELAKPVRELDHPDVTERLVTRREVLVIPWDALAHLPVSTPRTGPYRYVNKPDYEELMQRRDLIELKTEKGPIYVVKSFLRR